MYKRRTLGVYVEQIEERPARRDSYGGRDVTGRTGGDAFKRRTLKDTTEEIDERPARHDSYEGRDVTGRTGDDA